MANITLRVDEDVLAKVRRIAAERGTTLNGLVRDYLGRLAEREDRAKTARRELVRLSESATWDPGPEFNWSREAIYEERLSRYERHHLRGAGAPGSAQQAGAGEGADRDD